MAFQIVAAPNGFAHGGNESGSGTGPLTNAFSAVTGNLLIVAVSVFNPEVLPPAPTDNAGNVYTLIGSSPATPATTDGTPNVYFFYCNNIVGNAALQVGYSLSAPWDNEYDVNFSQVVVWQISGAAAGSAAINTFKIGGNTTGSNAQSTAALTTTVANSIVLAYGSLANTSVTYSAGFGYTIDMANSDEGGLSGCEHQQFSSIQTGIIPTITATDSTHKWQMMAVAVAGAASTHSISGNAGVAGANVAYSGTASGNVTADGSGNYTISGLADGPYTITPSLAGYTFSPTSASETLAGSNITGVNFTATSTGGPGTGKPYGWVNTQGDHYNKRGLR